LLERRPRKKCLSKNYALETFHQKNALMEEIKTKPFRKIFEKDLVRRLDAFTDFPTDINILVAKFAMLPFN